MSLLNYITTDAAKEIKSKIYGAHLVYGYLATLKLLTEYENKENYYVCYWLHKSLISHGKDVPTVYGKKALDYIFEYYESIGHPERFNAHLEGLEERANKMREYIESSWAFMNY